MTFDKTSFLSGISVGRQLHGWAGGDGIIVGSAPPAGCYIRFVSADPFSLAAPKNWDGTLIVSADGRTWREWDGSAISSRFDGLRQKILVAGTGNTIITGGEDESAAWTITQAEGAGGVAIGGNIGCLLDWRVEAGGAHAQMGPRCYAYMFYGCTALLSTPKIPATALSDYCYAYMFYGCTGLTAPCTLPATVLTPYCYSHMFAGCSNIWLYTEAIPDESLDEKFWGKIWSSNSSYYIPMCGDVVGDILIGVEAEGSLESMFDGISQNPLWSGGYADFLYPSFRGTPEINKWYGSRATLYAVRAAAGEAAPLLADLRVTVTIVSSQYRVRFPDVIGIPENFEAIKAQIDYDVFPLPRELNIGYDESLWRPVFGDGVTLLPDILYIFRYLTWRECQDAGYTWAVAEENGWDWEAFEKAVPPTE